MAKSKKVLNLELENEKLKKELQRFYDLVAMFKIMFEINDEKIMDRIYSLEDAVKSHNNY